MSRPEPIELENNLGPDAVTGEINRVPWKAYDVDEMDQYIAAKDAEIIELKDKCQMHDFFWEGCGFAKRGFKNTIAVSEAFDKLEAENAELKQKLEDVQASHYSEMVDAGMRERRLRRALWLARAERASDKALIFYFAMAESYPLNINGYSDKEKGHTRMRNAIWWRTTWLKVERKCRAKAEEYK